MPTAAANSARSANLCALGAIALWATLASLGQLLEHLPPFLLTGIALVLGSAPAWPRIREWRVAPIVLALGVYGLFGYHLLLFIALRTAPPVAANLVNYLWPLLLVLLTPLALPQLRLRPTHLAAALTGFAGAAVAILGAGSTAAARWSWGYLPALGAAFVWASYSLLTRRVPAFSTAAVGLFGLVSGVLSLLCHWAFEPGAHISPRDWALLAATGLGPLGAAFFLWDRALKTGDTRQIAILSYLTPLASTALLLAVTGRPWTWSIGLAALLIAGAAVLGTRDDPAKRARARTADRARAR